MALFSVAGLVAGMKLQIYIYLEIRNNKLQIQL